MQIILEDEGRHSPMDTILERESYNVTRTWYWVTLQGYRVLNY